MRDWEAAKNSLRCVLEAVTGESIVIICDDEKADVGRAFSEGAQSLGLWTRRVMLRTDKGFREEIPKYLHEVLTSKPDLYINLLRGAREETQFRIRIIRLQTRDKRARLGHCPGVTLDMLTDGALALESDEHEKMQLSARKLMSVLSSTMRIDIESPNGTDVSFSTINRDFFTDTMIDWKTMKWMNLPTGEVIVAPVEDSMNGRIVCDLAIGGIGSIQSSLELSVKNGRIENAVSEDRDTLGMVQETLRTDDWSDVVGEFAFGINPKARFVEEFLEAEKISGTIHIAFGANIDMPGGLNPSKNHMDFLVSKPTVRATKGNGEVITILENGKFTFLA